MLASPPATLTGTGDRCLMNTTCQPSCCPRAWLDPGLGSTRVQPGLPAALPSPKGKRAGLGGLPAPRQLR